MFAGLQLLRQLHGRPAGIAAFNGFYRLRLEKKQLDVERAPGMTDTGHAGEFTIGLGEQAQLQGKDRFPPRIEVDAFDEVNGNSVLPDTQQLGRHVNDQFHLIKRVGALVVVYRTGLTHVVDHLPVDFDFQGRLLFHTRFSRDFRRPRPPITGAMQMEETTVFCLLILVC